MLKKFYNSNKCGQCYKLFGIIYGCLSQNILKCVISRNMLQHPQGLAP